MRVGGMQPIPVSHAFHRVDGLQYREIWEALALVDAVHFDGALPRISIARGLPRRNEDGGFTPAKREIFVADNAISPRAAFWHELGHAIDRFGFGNSGALATRVDPRMAGWRSAVLQSRGYAEWHAQQQSAGDPALLAYLPYHLRMWELWARSYAQYIATRAGDSITLAFLQNHRTELPTGEVLVYQWGQVDFLPIADEIDSLFQRLGWIQ